MSELQVSEEVQVPKEVHEEVQVSEEVLLEALGFELLHRGNNMFDMNRIPIAKQTAEAFQSTAVVNAKLLMRPDWEEWVAAWHQAQDGFLKPFLRNLENYVYTDEFAQWLAARDQVDLRSLSISELVAYLRPLDQRLKSLSRLDGETLKEDNPELVLLAEFLQVDIQKMIETGLYQFKFDYLRKIMRSEPEFYTYKFMPFTIAYQVLNEMRWVVNHLCEVSPEKLLQISQCSLTILDRGYVTDVRLIGYKSRVMDLMIKYDCQTLSAYLLKIRSYFKMIEEHAGIFGIDYIYEYKIEDWVIKALDQGTLDARFSILEDIAAKFPPPVEYTPPDLEGMSGFLFDFGKPKPKSHVPKIRYNNSIWTLKDVVEGIFNPRFDPRG